MQYLTDRTWNLSTFKSLSLICAMLCLGFVSTEYRKVNSIKVQGRFFTTDNFGNAYVINAQNQLLKYGPDGNLLYTYNSKRYGQFDFVDVRNPFKILLLSRSFSTIVTLNNTLAESHVMNFVNLGMPRLGPVCRASDNSTWVYDEQDFKLKKVDDNQEVIFKSDELYLILSTKEIHPNFMIDRNNWLYMNEPDVGILVFDIYGTYAKTIPIKGLNSFQVVRDQLIYFQNGKCQTYHLKLLIESEIPLPAAEDLLDVRIEKDRLFLLRENHLDLYAY